MFVLHVASPKLVNEKSDTSVFDRVIGQTEAIETIKFYCAGNSNDFPVPTMLFSGGHGLGKTMMSKLVAEALGRHFIEINCENIEDSDEFFQLISSTVSSANAQKGIKGITILLDEAHAIKKPVKDALLSILNPNRSNVNTFEQGSFRIVWSMQFINVIFATTDAHEIASPLRNRCVNVDFLRYSQSEITSILKNYLGVNVDLKCNLNEIVQVCRERARNTYMLSQDILRYLAARKNHIVSGMFTDADLARLKKIRGWHEYGLTSNEKELFRIIKEHGPISLSAISAKMMVSPSVVEEEFEIRLRELNFIENSKTGRVITELGKKIQFHT